MIDAIQFSSFSEFLNMGGYAFNVWSVYLLFAVFLFVNLYGPMRHKKQLMRRLKRKQVVSTGRQENIIHSGGLSPERSDGENSETTSA